MEPTKTIEMEQADSGTSGDLLVDPRTLTRSASDFEGRVWPAGTPILPSVGMPDVFAVDSPANRQRYHDLKGVWPCAQTASVWMPAPGDGLIAPVSLVHSALRTIQSNVNEARGWTMPSEAGLHFLNFLGFDTIRTVEEVANLDLELATALEARVTASLPRPLTATAEYIDLLRRTTRMRVIELRGGGARTHVIITAVAGELRLAARQTPTWEPAGPAIVTASLDAYQGWLRSSAGAGREPDLRIRTMFSAAGWSSAVTSIAAGADRLMLSAPPNADDPKRKPWSPPIQMAWPPGTERSADMRDLIGRCAPISANDRVAQVRAAVDHYDFEPSITASMIKGYTGLRRREVERAFERLQDEQNYRLRRDSAGELLIKRDPSAEATHLDLDDHPPKTWVRWFVLLLCAVVSAVIGLVKDAAADHWNWKKFTLWQLLLSMISFLLITTTIKVIKGWWKHRDGD